MTKIVEAIYSNGMFQPLEALDLSEQQRVRLIIHPIANGSTIDREAAFRRFVEGVRSMNFRLDGPMPTRDELHER